MNRLVPVATVVVLVLLVLWRIGVFGPQKPIESVKEAGEKAVGVITGDDGFSFDQDIPGYETYLSFIQGCPTKDCIPSIDDPKFESVSAADEWLDEEDVVFVVDYKGQVKAYPQRILNWHEIVNDVIGDPLVITFCPLCGSALTFDRRVDGQTLEFGVSGKLHNNDLVMYDRQTESLWQQITGGAIVGELFGKRLAQIPTSGMRFSQFKIGFPNGEVLSRDTGFRRDYDSYPYGNYESDTNPLFPVEGGVDTTIHPKAVVYGVIIGEEAKAYSEGKIREEGIINDEVGGVSIKISYNNGDVNVIRSDDLELAATRLFWFAWKAFHPDTKLY